MSSDQDALHVDHELIAKAALCVYLDQLPSRGAKPATRSNGRIEWTVFAAFVLSYEPPNLKSHFKNQHQDHSASGRRVYTVISCATGLRCLPYASIPLNGDVLHDQHAEVLARRGARHWLLTRLHYEATAHTPQGLTIFESTSADQDQAQAQAQGKGTPRWKLGQGVRLHLYVSTLPCGDASNKLLEFQRAAQDQCSPNKDVLTPEQLLALYTAGLSTSNAHLASHNDSFVSNQAAANVVRGRASSAHQQQQQQQSMSNVGALRTKPGRPDSPPSICMSCSDKISLWNAPGVGMQGSLLSALLEPVYIDSITVSDHPIKQIFPVFPRVATDAGADADAGAETCYAHRQELKKILAHECKRSLQRARNHATAAQEQTQSEINVGWSVLPFADSKEAKLEHAWTIFQTHQQQQQQQAEQAKTTAEIFQMQYEPVSCPNSILYIAPPSYASEEGQGKTENLASGTKLGASTKRPKPKAPSSHKDQTVANEPLKPAARSIVCRLNYFTTFTTIYNSLFNTNIGIENCGMLYSHAKEGIFGQGTKEYRRNKDNLLGNKQNSKWSIQSFLSKANQATAIQTRLVSPNPVELEKTKQLQLQLQLQSEQIARFNGWLRTPDHFSHFDLQGRTSELHG